MRIWSIHPKYLDSKRLTAQWREGLLCRAALRGKTSYIHDNFMRVKNHVEPEKFINSYLYEIWYEGDKRGFKFDKSKLEPPMPVYDAMEITEDELEYEYNVMQNFLGEFDKQRAFNEEYINEEGILANILFIVVPNF